MEYNELYKRYDDKSLVGTYIFNYHVDNLKRRDALLNELQQRGLEEWARQTFKELYDSFCTKWVRKEEGDIDVPGILEGKWEDVL